MGNAYVKSLARYAKAVTGELNNKLNANINLNLRSAIDPLGDSYATTISNLRKNGILAANQAAWLLEESNYFPEEMPEASTSPVPISTSKDDKSAEGGDNDDED